MREFHAYYDNDAEEFKGIMANDGRLYDIEGIVELVNRLEKYRIRKNKEIMKYKKREDRFQKVICGLLAYIELRVNDELWWDLNE